jgi:leucyl-tRNA synthetase
MGRARRRGAGVERNGRATSLGWGGHATRAGRAASRIPWFPPPRGLPSGFASNPPWNRGPRHPPARAPPDPGFRGMSQPESAPRSAPEPVPAPGSGQADLYHPAELEAKWQARWDAEGTNAFTRAELEAPERPFYNLMMFPYPSAEGLHVGNIYAFTGADVHGRYQRLRGRDVFEPIGFDAFGIHSENFALKVGVHPMDLIPRNVANFTRQLRRIGGMFDWDHTVDTTAPEYYRWTQWLFLQLYKGGLAERKEAPVNWCPSCMTVLANEQVVGGACERCDPAVEQRRIAQWFFRISKYAPRLLENLATLDWSDTTRRRPRRTGSAEATAPSSASPHAAGAGAPATDPGGVAVEVFTTRPDTIFGATWMVLAPEHPLVDRFTSEGAAAEVEAYRDRRSEDGPRGPEEDRQDEDRGLHRGALPEPRHREARPRLDLGLRPHGVRDRGHHGGAGPRRAGLRVRHRLRAPIVRVVAGEGDDASTPLAEALYRPRPPRELRRLRRPGGGGGEAPDHRVARRAGVRRGHGELPPPRLVHLEAALLGPAHPHRLLRRLRRGAGARGQLPVVLPRVEDFKPDDSGVSPLARVAEWYETACPTCGGAARRETDVSDTFLDSAWYFLRYPSTDFHDRAFDPDVTKAWLPVDTYIGGNEHAVLHLLYSRFITMALHDLGHLDFEEPFTRFRAHGLIVKDGAKMSKSKGNVVVPDPIIEEYGADTFRLYLMFLGPFEEGGDYRDAGIAGPWGFLKRLWDTVVPVEALSAEPPEPAVERKLHRTIEQVTRQLPELGYNTSIAAMMEYLNAVRTGGRTPRRGEVEPLVPLIAPFCPHLAEELWARLGHEGSIFDGENWPAYDPALLVEDAVTVAVQVNGKVRSTLELPRGTSEEEALAAARADEKVARFLDGAELRRVIHVQDRLLNLVVA